MYVRPDNPIRVRRRSDIPYQDFLSVDPFPLTQPVSVVHLSRFSPPPPEWYLGHTPHPDVLRGEVNLLTFPSTVDQGSLSTSRTRLLPLVLDPEEVDPVTIPTEPAYDPPPPHSSYDSRRKSLIPRGPTYEPSSPLGSSLRTWGRSSVVLSRIPRPCQQHPAHTDGRHTRHTHVGPDTTPQGTT